MVYITKKYAIEPPTVFRVDGLIRAPNWDLSDGLFRVAKGMPFIFISSWTTKPVIWVLFHEMKHVIDGTGA